MVRSEDDQSGVGMRGAAELREQFLETLDGDVIPMAHLDNLITCSRLAPRPLLGTVLRWASSPLCCVTTSSWWVLSSAEIQRTFGLGSALATRSLTASVTSMRTTLMTPMGGTSVFGSPSTTLAGSGMATALRSEHDTSCIPVCLAEGAPEV